MDKIKMKIMIVVCSSIMVASLSQVVYWTSISEWADGGWFLLSIPCIIVFLNLVLCLKFRIRYIEYIMSVYLGFVLSIATMSIILFLDQPENLSPGEQILHTDDVVMSVFFTFVTQAIILLLLNLASFVIYKIFMPKKIVSLINTSDSEE